MSLGQEKTIIVVDSQKVNMVSMCGFKYDLSFNGNFRPVLKPEPLDRGDMIHQMVACYYQSLIDEKGWSQTETLKQCNEVGEKAAAELDLQTEDVDNVFRTFKDYLTYYWGEQYVPLFTEKIASKLLHEDDEIAIIYEGKIDLAFRTKNMPVLLTDHKSSQRRGNTIAISNQFMGYCWLMDQNNLMVNKIGFQKTVKPAEKFSRPIMSYPPAVIENWRLNSIWWIKEILRYTRENHWPQNFTSCDKYSDCIFHEICEAPPENKSHKIAELFQVGQVWDPGANL